MALTLSTDFTHPHIIILDVYQATFGNIMVYADFWKTLGLMFLAN